MAKSCWTFDHTADVGLDARADTLGELFEALAMGTAEVVSDPSQARPLTTRTISLEAPDLEDLAVDFLSAVLWAIQANRFVIGSVKVTAVDDRRIHAELAGEKLDLARHELKTEVKAVTYHQLRIAREGDQWVGRVILDL